MRQHAYIFQRFLYYLIQLTNEFLIFCHICVLKLFKNVNDKVNFFEVSEFSPFFIYILVKAGISISIKCYYTKNNI